MSQFVSKRFTVEEPRHGTKPAEIAKYANRNSIRGYIVKLDSDGKRMKIIAHGTSSKMSAFTSWLRDKFRLRVESWSYNPQDGKMFVRSS